MASRYTRARSHPKLLHQICDTRLSRRQLLQGSLFAAMSGFLPGVALGAAASPRVGFRAVPAREGRGPWVTLSPDYEFQVLLPWGESLKPGTPDFDGDPAARPDAAAQARQVGIGHDGMTYFALEGSSERGLLVVNHEFGTNVHVLGKALPETPEELLRSQHAHGVSVAEIHRGPEGWAVALDSPLNRRIHVNTPVTFSGPAAGSRWLAPETGARGTLANCANGQTPWGTYLTAEENFDDYFGAAGEWSPSPTQQRYGFSRAGGDYGWHRIDSRFDLASAESAREENRFGWIVEIDPLDPEAPPVKRTALGRFKHEGTAVAEGAGGRIVVYMADDEVFEHIYKFVSSADWRVLREQGRSPLDEGILYVARFDAGGRGEWLPLVPDHPALRGRFGSAAEILTFARLAADALGATPMDRPEWTAVAPDGTFYCTLTKNGDRQAPNAANPRAPNPHGHIVRWRDEHGHTGTRFDWDIFLFADDTHGEEDERSFSAPDGLWVDPDGRIFIETDGDQVKGLNNQLLVGGTAGGRPELRRLLTGPAGCEVTGLATTPDRRTLFVNIQHPGDGDPARTSFPAPLGSGLVPRDCTLAIRRKDGGLVGS